MEPKIGVGVFVFDKTGKIVLGKRKGSHGSGTESSLPFLRLSDTNLTFDRNMGTPWRASRIRRKFRSLRRERSPRRDRVNDNQPSVPNYYQ